MTMLDHALKYLELGLSVLPIPVGAKHPWIKWAPYQDRLPTEKEVRAWWKDNPDYNIACVTGVISKTVVADQDTPEAVKKVREIVKNSLNTPTAITPRGGEHLHYFSIDEKLRVSNDPNTNCDFKANGGLVLLPPSSNGTGKSYAWKKGMSPFEMALLPLPESYIAFNKSLSLYRVTNRKLQTVTSVTDGHRFFQDGSRDNDLYYLAKFIMRGGGSPDLAIQVLERLAKSCKPVFPSGDVPIKVNSAIQSINNFEGNLSHEIEEWVGLQTGYFSVTQGHSELHLVTKQEKNNFKQVIHRLKTKNVIESSGNRAGQYRKIEVEFDIVTDFKETDGDPLGIEYPLGIHDYSETYENNIIVVAGEKESGKTAFCMKVAGLNINKGMKVRYISSEFGSGELLNRLRQDKDTDPEKWIKKIEFGQFSRNEYHDVILPNAINILDFLEVSDGEFFKIGDQIKKIHQKLRKGICIIAIQKKRGQDLARGGDLSAEKARLYLTLGRDKGDKGQLVNKCHIVYCKNPVQGAMSPRDTFCEYKLGGGHYFKRTTPWLPA